MLPILFENFEQFATVGMYEFGKRLKERKHDVVDEPKLHTVNID